MKRREKGCLFDCDAHVFWKTPARNPTLLSSILLIDYDINVRIGGRRGRVVKVANL